MSDEDFEVLLRACLAAVDEPDFPRQEGLAKVNALLAPHGAFVERTKDGFNLQASEHIKEGLTRAGDMLNVRIALTL